MRKIPSTEVKASFAEIVRSVERGETVAITRHGRDVAHLIPSRTHLAVDASVVVDALLANYGRELVDGLYATYAIERLNRNGGLVPPNWHSEVRNSLLVAHRQGRLPKDEAVDCLDSLKALPIVTEQEADLDTALKLALTHDLSFHDAMYLELATRRGLPLATLNQGLSRAALAERVEVFNPY